MFGRGTLLWSWKLPLLPFQTPWWEACLRIHSRRALLCKAVALNQGETPKQRMLSIPEWWNQARSVWQKPNFLSCLRKWRHVWHLWRLYSHGLLTACALSRDATCASIDWGCSRDLAWIKGYSCGSIALWSRVSKSWYQCLVWGRFVQWHRSAGTYS